MSKSRISVFQTRRLRFQQKTTLAEQRSRPLSLARPSIADIQSFRRYASNAGRSSGVHEPTIDHETVRRKNRRQVGWRVEPSRAPEERIVMVEHGFERRCGIVVKVRRGSADSPQLCDVHHSEIGDLASEQQSSRIRRCECLRRAIGERDSIRARVRAPSRGGHGRYPSVAGRGQAVWMLW